MHTKYIGNKNFREINLKLDDLGVWKFILKNRNLALKCMNLRIVDGKTYSLWFDP